MNLVLRENQNRFIALLRNEYDAGHDAVMGVAPTGFGKTICIVDILLKCLANGNTAFVFVHKRELIRQTSNTLRKFGIAHGVICSGYPEENLPVQICSVQTFARRMQRFKVPDFAIFDEAHHCLSNQFLIVWQWAHRALKLGVTATPWRLDRKGFDDLFSSMVLADDVATLIAKGYLSRPIFYAPPIPGTSMEGVGKIGGDFNRKEQDLIMNKPAIIGSAVEHYKRLLPSHPATIAFTSSVDGAQRLAEKFIAEGVGAASIDGSMSDDERVSILRQLADGEISVLCSCDLVSEGFDLSAAAGRDIAVAGAIMLRHTESLSLYIQQAGRALRPATGKSETLILDHVGNWLRHGLIDEPREWSLEGREKKSKRNRAETLTTCRKCYAVFPPEPKCPSCGYVFAIAGGKAERGELEEKEGQLVQLNGQVAAEIRKKRANHVIERKLERA